MTFDEWLETYYSGTQIDDIITGMMRTAFEAGRCEAGTVGLRDQIAMAAMQGIVCEEGCGNIEWPHNIAEDAYKVADAMLKERAK